MEHTHKGDACSGVAQGEIAMFFLITIKALIIIDMVFKDAFCRQFRFHSISLGKLTYEDIIIAVFKVECRREAFHLKKCRRAIGYIIAVATEGFMVYCRSKVAGGIGNTVKCAVTMSLRFICGVVGVGIADNHVCAGIKVPAKAPQPVVAAGA